jgi:site-specific DNA-methyltransferase (adenine-specific)
MLQISNEDNMELMARYPDKYFDLAIVDPPYGIDYAKIAGKESGTQYGNATAPKKIYVVKKWDSGIPEKSYFIELFRVSKNQIIWGANYMVEFIPPSMGWVFWDKDNSSNGYSDGELAFTSFEVGLRKFKFTWHGMIQGNMKNKEDRFHPTQKPVALYKWLLSRYAKPSDKILDTHLGSGSIAIACHDLGFDLTACELDKDYFDSAMARIKLHTEQGQLFEPKELHKSVKNNELFGGNNEQA